MLTYTNHLKKLILPEYGRNIQNMVDYCLSLADPIERTDCAYAIVDAMATLFPPVGDPGDYNRKLWDHLHIMANFQLDVDAPYDAPDMTEHDQGPAPVPAERPGYLKMRHYGQLIPRLIDTACAMPEGDERMALVQLIVNQMKKTLMASNPESADDRRIINDLRMLSHGQIIVDQSMVLIHDYKQAPTPSGKRKKKK